MPAPKPAAGTTPSRADPRPLRQGAPGAERGEAWDARAEVRRVSREDAAEFAALEAAWVDELASVGTLQIVLTRRVAVVASRLARADRLAAGTGLGPRRRTERGLGPIPQPVRRRPPAANRPSCSPSAGGTTPVWVSSRSSTPMRSELLRRCCATAVPPSPSSGGGCAPSRHSRPSRRYRWTPLQPGRRSPHVFRRSNRAPHRSCPRTARGRLCPAEAAARDAAPNRANPRRARRLVGHAMAAPPTQAGAPSAPRTRLPRLRRAPNRTNPKRAEREHADKRQPEYVLGQRKAPGGRCTPVLPWLPNEPEKAAAFGLCHAMAVPPTPAGAPGAPRTRLPRLRRVPNRTNPSAARSRGQLRAARTPPHPAARCTSPPRPAAERTRQRSAAAVGARPDQRRPGHSIPLPCRAARRQRNDLLTGPSKAHRGFRGSHGPAKEMANQGEGTINSLATLGPVRIRSGTAPPRAPKDSMRRRGLALTPPPGAPTSPRSRGRET